MQKKIIVLAVAAALSAPALALADIANITVYGQANVSYDMITTGDAQPTTAANKGTSSWRVSSNSSRFGLKGSEDLGGGLSAIWQVESQLTLDGNAGNGLGTRNTFLGLKSDSMGTLTAGNNDTPYKISTRRLDVFMDGIADNRTLMGRGTAAPGGANFDGRQIDLVTYTSPNFSGITAAFAFANRAETNFLDTATKRSTTSLAAMYDVAPFYGSFAYETHDNKPNAGASTAEKATKLAVGYTMDALNVNFVYESTSDDFGLLATDSFGHTAMYLSGKFNISAAGAVKAAFTKMGQLGTATADTGATQFSLGYDHSLSKRTTVYALYTSLKNEKFATNQLGLAPGGIATSATNMNPPGNTATALSFGVKHSF